MTDINVEYYNKNADAFFQDLWVRICQIYIAGFYLMFPLVEEYWMPDAEAVETVSFFWMQDMM